MKKIPASIGICAYNEEENIGKLLEFLLGEQSRKILIGEIIVVASGCTDGTEKIVKKFMKEDRRVRLITEGTRRGKASAVNLIIQNAQNQIIVLESADTIPAKGTVEKLVLALREPEVGLVAARPIPQNTADTLVGFAVNLQWELHHLISLRRPKAGEMIAFKKIFNQIHPKTPVDEALVECLIAIQGYEIRYEPEAIVYNKGAETLRDFLRQRRRIHAGHLAAKAHYGYSVATLNSLAIFPYLLRVFKPSRQFFLYAPVVILLELVGRTFGWFDYHFKTREHTIWKISQSTKKLQ